MNLIFQHSTTIILLESTLLLENINGQNPSKVPKTIVSNFGKQFLRIAILSPHIEVNPPELTPPSVNVVLFCFYLKCLHRPQYSLNDSETCVSSPVKSASLLGHTGTTKFGLKNWENNFKFTKTCSGKSMPSSVVEVRYNLNILIYISITIGGESCSVECFTLLDAAPLNFS